MDALSSYTRNGMDQTHVEKLQTLARELAPYLDAYNDKWLDSKGAQEYLAMSKAELDRLSARREIPFSQDRPNSKRYYKKSLLDKWRLSRST